MIYCGYGLLLGDKTLWETNLCSSVAFKSGTISYRFSPEKSHYSQHADASDPSASEENSYKSDAIMDNENNTNASTAVKPSPNKIILPVSCSNIHNLSFLFTTTTNAVGNFIPTSVVPVRHRD